MKADVRHAVTPYRRRQAKTGYLVLWDAPETPGILRLRDRSLLACLRFKGPDLHSAPESVLITQANRLNETFRRFKGGWSVMTEARRRELRDYPPTKGTTPVVRLIDAKRRAHFTRAQTHFGTEMFATLVWQPPQVVLPEWKHWLYTNLPPDTTLEDQRGFFEEEVQRAASLLGACCRDVERLEGSALLTYLHGTVNMTPQTVKWPAEGVFLDTYIARDTLERLYRPPSLWRWPCLDGQWLRAIGVEAYPAETHPGILDTMEQLPLEYRAVIRHVAMDRAQAIEQLRRYRRQHYGQRLSTSAALMEKFSGEPSPMLEQAALDHEADANAAQAAVEHNQVSYGYLTQVVVVWDGDFKRATDKAKLVEEALNTAGFTAKIETYNTMAAWEGSIPGNTYANEDRPPMHSKNLAHLVPATSPERGKPWNTHLAAPAVLLATGRGAVPFWLNHHVGDVGHFKVIAPVGAGKSTLLALLAVQWWARYGEEAPVFALDKGGSLKCATYAVGGQWHDMGRVFHEEAQVGARLDDATFQPWGVSWHVPPGHWHCFEMQELLRTPQLAGAVFRTIYNEVVPRLTGAPALFLMDEGYILLRHNPAVMQDGLKDLRKKECSVGVFIQSIGDYMQSPIAHDLHEQCMTTIFGANADARHPETGKLYTALGCSDRQRELIAHLIPKQQYYYMGYGDEGCQVFDLALCPTQLAFVGRSRPRDLAAMDELYQGDARQFSIDWLHREGLHQDADALKSEGDEG